MIDQAEARMLVTSYIRAFHACWKSVARAFRKDVDFKRWSKLIRRLDAGYFAPRAGSGEEGSYGTPPSHDPKAELITGFVPEKDGVARVETSAAGTGGAYWEYEIIQCNGKPRIAKARHFLEPKGTPLVTAKDARRVLAAPSLAGKLGPLARGVDPNGDWLFAPKRSVRVGGKTYRIATRTLGELNTKSGVLAVRDFGYDAHGLAALQRKVRPGKYPVDVAIVASRVAALRVTFAPRPVSRWHPANFGRQGHVVGVDAGNVALFDVASFVELDSWEKERLFEAAVVGAEAPNARLVSLREPNDCVIVDSGYGDGCYPCYWGADAKGEVSRLFVDFLMAATFLEETIRVPAARSVAHPLLRQWQVEVAMHGSSLKVRGGAFKRARLLRGEKQIVDTDRVGLEVRGDVRTYDLGEAGIKARSTSPLTIEVTLSTGYRNGAVR